MYFVSGMHIILSCMVEFIWYCWCPEQTKLLIAGAIALKGLGGVLFIFGSSFGALLLVCIQIFFNTLDFIFFSHAPYSSFDSLFNLFIVAAAPASAYCDSYSLWFLQLWEWGQRIYSTFHQIYTGQRSNLFLKKIIFNTMFPDVYLHLLNIL